MRIRYPRAMWLAVGFVPVFLAVGIAWSPSPARATAPQPADLLLYNGHVITVDDNFSIASAVAVKDGRILAVGGNELRNEYHATKEIDLQGRTLMPGFDDVHIHIMGSPRNYIDLNATDSLEQLRDQIRAKVKLLGTGQWITGYGWNEFNFPKAEQHPPHREDLDADAPDNPVVITRSGGHSCAANSMALRLAGITAQTPQPAHGMIEHEADGQPNGVIRERCDLITRLVPQESEEELRPTYVASLKKVLSLGITSIVVAGASIYPDQGLSFYQFETIYHEYGNELPRATLEIDYPGPAALKTFTDEVGRTGYGDDRLRIGPIGETPIDGGFTGPTAWMLEQYKDQPGFYGKPRFSPQQVQDMIDTGAQLGWQFGIHAIGDAATQELVAAYDHALHAYPQDVGKDPRWWLAHFEIMPPPATMRMIIQDHIIVAQQPNFLYNLAPRYEAILYPQQLDTVIAANTLLKDGIFVAFSSDDMPIGPMIGLYGAVTHRGIDGALLSQGERVSMEQAIRMYTRNGAYFTFEEKKKGAIEPGMLADMIVLPEDPLKIDPRDILNLKVDMTIVGGRIVYDRSAAESAAKAM
jgi:predicted amidohydrolase YtcJ